ncbi:MAG: TraR/DksA family transcriptional regulator [Phycisphaeraceae bacterium]
MSKKTSAASKDARTRSSTKTQSTKTESTKTQSTKTRSTKTQTRKKRTTSQPPAPAPAPTPIGAHPVGGVPHENGQRLSDDQLRKVKTGLTKRDLEKFRKLLLEKRAELVGDVESLQIDARNDDASISYEHMADVGSDSYEQEFTLGLVESERKLLGEIDEALDRISKGTFGVCVQSGEPISKARLEAKPWAKYTIEVAREREKRGLN